MKIRTLTFLSFLLIIFSLKAQSPSSAEIINRAIEVLDKTRSMSVDFNISVGPNKGKGSLKVSGNKFQVSMPDVKVWYNGKEMFTYNDNIKETTEMIPTVEELREVNPLLYIKSAKSGFNSKYADKKIAGKYIIELTPKTKGSDVKKIIITLKSDYLPEKIKIDPISGQSIELQINQINKNASFKPSDFEYPQSQYKGIEIIDLR